ncbi:MAG: hypothetical protein OXR70_07520 [Candidatus Marinimicrobia bacterium]|jgi:hypothetical protein|nr:hypothetical protein [Candidatus Neomarinimicrobiota bacterium]MDD9888667.1 hypothetical protein [Candidatus Neomarinimicrobiota bacterium]MDD9931700.1 hypothetical protein [Candidatus Neomarinimicrobiota bacterium]
MKNFKQFLMVAAFLGLWSCAEKETASKTATFLVTTNVRGQLDPCG